MRRLLVLLAAALAAAPTAHAAFPAGPPNDPLFDQSPLPNATNEQWDLASPAAGFDRGISADRAWRLTTGAGVVIAEIDVGAQLDHPDLRGRFTSNGYDFYARDANPSTDTGNSHGTNVAGVLGARANNGEGIAGIAPSSPIMVLRTSDDILHRGSRLAEALVYAADHGARVVSMSLGADSFPSGMRKAAAYAARRGVVMTAAMGNEFHFHHHAPMVYDDVIGVGGVNPDSANSTALNGSLALVGTNFEVRAHYSDYGPHIDVVAPTQVPTTNLGGGYLLNWSGTSAASPHVAGTAALVLARARAKGLTLASGEVKQILRMSADDLTDAAEGERTGWDKMTGWGRVNAYEAVRRAEPGRVPPETNISSPDWYEPVRGRLDVRGLVRGRSPSRWVLELGQGEEPSSWRRLASGTATPRRGRRMARVDGSKLAAGGWTLRLRSTDSRGNRGEDRAFFHVLGSQALQRRFPKRLGTSGESSPVLANLTRSPGREILLATSDGRVRAWTGSGRRLRGWPRSMKRLEGSGPAARRIGTLRAGFLATPAVGNIRGSRRPEVVAAGLDGRVYAWTARGRRVKGFPVRIDPLEPAARGELDRAIYASPALADLNGDGKLDIVVGAADQKVYAWDGRGRRIKGWPVLARDGKRAKIISSPAIGDLDGDHRPDIVEGTGEGYGSTPLTTARVYAWRADGTRLPGWPVEPPALAADSIPIAGEGVPDSPDLADVDGDGRDEVAVAAFTGQPELYAGDGTRMDDGHFRDTGGVALGANGAFGRTRPGGPLRFFSGLVDAKLALAQTMPASRVPFDHLLGGWDAASGEPLAAFPRKVEGWTILTAPAVADVDGDGTSEVLQGGSGNVLHAFREDGSEPAGWPKHAGGWLLASPAVGNVDRDRAREVVAATRDGWLYVWQTGARQGAPADWPSFRHDSRNSGRFGP